MRISGDIVYDKNRIVIRVEDVNDDGAELLPRAYLIGTNYMLVKKSKLVP